MFSFKYWRQDLQASLVVFLVALPLCLGIALASNAPLASGLIAGVIGGLVVGALTNSSISVSGPAAGLTVIVINSIESLGSFEAFTLAVLISGVIQIAFGFFKAGKLGNYFPSAVIKGMLAAIGIILILKQLPHAVGYDVEHMGSERFGDLAGENTFTGLMNAFTRIHPGAVIIALMSLGIMLGWERLSNKSKFFQIVPGALVAVASAVFLNEVFKSGVPVLAIEASHLVQLPFTSFQDVMSGLKLPDFGAITNPQVYITAMTLALVGSLESLLSVDAADKLDSQGKVTNKNRELFAQGCGNTLSGLVGGLPITAVIVRSSANVAAGGKTKLSAFLHGIWLFGCVVMIGEILNLIPLASLAAVLLLVGYKLTKPALYRSTLKRGMSQFIPFMATIVAILFTDLLIGISFGMLVGFAFVIKSNMHKSVSMVSDGNLYLIRFSKDVSFMQKPDLLEKFDQIPKGAQVVIDGSKGGFVDQDIVELIEDFMQNAPKKEIQVELRCSTTALCPLFKLSHQDQVA